MVGWSLGREINDGLEISDAREQAEDDAAAAGRRALRARALALLTAVDPEAAAAKAQARVLSVEAESDEENEYGALHEGGKTEQSGGQRWKP